MKEPHSSTPHASLSTRLSLRTRLRTAACVIGGVGVALAWAPPILVMAVAGCCAGESDCKHNHSAMRV
jgi:hypothetical protein